MIEMPKILNFFILYEHVLLALVSFLNAGNFLFVHYTQAKFTKFFRFIVLQCGNKVKWN